MAVGIMISSVWRSSTPGTPCSLSSSLYRLVCPQLHNPCSPATTVSLRHLLKPHDNITHSHPKFFSGSFIAVQQVLRPHTQIQRLSTSLASTSSQPCTKGKGEFGPVGPEETREQGEGTPRTIAGSSTMPTGTHAAPNRSFVAGPVCKPSIDANGRIVGKWAQKGRSATPLAQRGK